MSIKITTVGLAHETSLEQGGQAHSITVDIGAISSWVFCTVGWQTQVAFKKVTRTDVTTNKAAI